MQAAGDEYVDRSCLLKEVANRIYRTGLDALAVFGGQMGLHQSAQIVEDRYIRSIAGKNPDPAVVVEEPEDGMSQVVEIAPVDGGVLARPPPGIAVAHGAYANERRRRSRAGGMGQLIRRQAVGQVRNDGTTSVEARSRHQLSRAEITIRSVAREAQSAADQEAADPRSEGLEANAEEDNFDSHRPSDDRPLEKGEGVTNPPLVAELTTSRDNQNVDILEGRPRLKGVQQFEPARPPREVKARRENRFQHFSDDEARVRCQCREKATPKGRALDGR